MSQSRGKGSWWIVSHTHDENTKCVHRDILTEYIRKTQQAPAIAGCALGKDDDWFRGGLSDVLEGMKTGGIRVWRRYMTCEAYHL